MDFFTAFLVEKSLSVDNLFVFLMIFEYFKVPEAHTQRVLKWGILSALVLRGVMIGLGVAVVTRFRPVQCCSARPAHHNPPQPTTTHHNPPQPTTTPSNPFQPRGAHA